MGDRNGDAVERHALSVGVHPQCHRSAGTECGTEQVVRRRTSIESTDRFRLVCQEPVAAHDDMVEERTLRGLGDHHRRRRPRCLQCAALVDDVAFGERPDHVGSESRIIAVGEEVIGAVERHEALRVTRRLEDLRRMVDRHGVVDRRVQHQQRPLHRRDPIGDHVSAQVVDELLANGERSSCQLHLGNPGRGDLVERRLEDVGHVIGARRRTDRGNRTHFGNVGGHREHR